MKKSRLLVILLAAAFLFGACAPSIESKSSEETPTAVIPEGTDYDNRFGMNYDNIIETKDCYYVKFSRSTYLFYYDKASGESGVLCGKPECMHDSSTCPGNISNLCATLNYWDDRIHYYSNDSSSHAYAVYSMKLYGSDKTRDTVVNDPSVMKGETPQRLDYHRGKLYGWTNSEIVENGEPMFCARVISIDPDSGELKELFSVKEAEYVSQPSLCYCGNYVYICCDTSRMSENGSYYVSVYLMRWNIETEELEEVLITDSDELGCVGSWFQEYAEPDGRVWFMPKGVAREKGRVYLVENGKLSEAFRFDNTGGYYLVQRAAVSISVEDALWEIRKLDGSLIYEGELDMSFLDELDPEEGYKVNAVYSLMGSAEEIFISYYLYAKKDERFTECLVRYDLTGGAPVPTIIACADDF